MNSYTKHHILKFYKKYESRSFDQDDVALFIVLARDYTPKGSIFRELGDFLGHPDKKDRGIVIDSYSEVIKLFDQEAEIFFDERHDEINMKPPKGLGLTEEIHASLCDVFALVGLTDVAKDRNYLPFRDFVFCLIFLLSNFKLEINDKLHNMVVDYGHSVSLTISYESKQYPRNYIKLNVIFLGNVNTMSIYTDLHEKLENHIVRRFDNGLLGAIPYDIDNNSFCKGMSNLDGGICWPLPNYR
ncbi:MAG: hypothetical protein AB7F25_11990 [Deferribacterales bacterium]